MQDIMAFLLTGMSHLTPLLDPFYEDAWWAKLGYVSGRMKTTQHVYHSRCNVYFPNKLFAAVSTSLCIL